METLGDKILPKFCSKFYCKNCDYGTSKKSSYDDHLLSAKHQKRRFGDVLETNANTILPKFCSSKFACEKCNKEYASRNGLWKHKQNCKTKEESKENKKDEITDKELMLALIKDSSEIKNMIMEVFKNGTTNHSHNTTTNSHNKAFNLNFFLNETCKDAMNIMDFVDSIKLQLSDLEGVGELGYVEGISNIVSYKFPK